MEERKKLTFIHISDIHFTKYSGDAYDLDEELRSAMLADLKRNAKDTLEKLSGVLVCGDLAFSGKKEEFDHARKFLEEVTGHFDISLKDVFCVAGNHDVDQDIIKASKILECMQQEVVKIATEMPGKLETELRKIQNDKFVKGLLYLPLEAYNECVEEMSCNYSVKCPTWSTRLELNEKYVLEIIGMNSVLTSNHKDHLNEKGRWMEKEERRMVVNRYQIPTVKENTVYLSLCHHPPECWSNPELQKMLDERVILQLYGHKHIHNIDANEKRIRISSGALQPERGNDWQARYNWLKIWIENELLCVKIYPRVFDDKKGKFIPDSISCDEGCIYHLIQIRLEGEDDKKTEGNKEAVDRSELMIIEQDNQKEEGSVRSTDIYTKEIVYRFLTLSQKEKEGVLREFPDVKIEPGDDVAVLLQELKTSRQEENFLRRLRCCQ